VSQLIKRIKLEKYIICWGKGTIVGVEKKKLFRGSGYGA
jgi:hypothetical protein